MKKILAIIAALFLGITTFATPVFATDNNECTCSDGTKGITTSVLGGEKKCVCDDGKGSAIFGILKQVLDIMSIAIGILGVIGVSVVGVQYLTAGGNEEKTRKAKRRMLEIVIGLVAYVLIYALLRFLLPDFEESMKNVQFMIHFLSL